MTRSAFTLVLPVVVFFTPRSIEAQTPVEIEIAPQGRFQVDVPHCAPVRLRDRPSVGPAPAWRPRIEPAPLVPSTKNPPCTGSEWAALTGAALVEAIASSTTDCLSVLWTYDAQTAEVVSAVHVEDVATEIVTESRDPVTNAARLERLCLFLQIAFFHEFYQAGTDYSPITDAAARDAIVTLGHRPELLTSLSGMPSLRAQWSVSMDSTNSTLDCLDQVDAILARFNSDPSLVLAYEESLTIYYCLFSLQRQIYNDHLAYGPSSPWIGAVTVSLSDNVRDLAVNVDSTPYGEPLTNNAIWALGHFSYLDVPTADRGRIGTSDAYRIQPIYSGPWIWSIQTLEASYAATLDDDTVLDVDALRAQVRAFALPNIRSFDQGSIVFETALTAEAVDHLYAAIKEVTAQFFRKCTFLDPVPGDANDEVTLLVYQSPEDYARYQTFLFGTSTSNGGIYLEELGTLCTYDRKPAESIYTLEELVRHEFTHYLDARYNITGGFNESGTLYAGGRIDSYVEGLAEFEAGSTRIQGVLPRRKLLQLVESDSVRMSVADVLAATYSQGFTFYRYAGLLFDYLDEERPELFWTTIQAIRGNNPAVVEALEARLAGDHALQSGFDAWLDQEIALSHDGQTLFAEDVPTVLSPTNLPLFNDDVVLGDLIAAVPGGEFRTWPGRYRYEGTLTLPSIGLARDEQCLLSDEHMDVVLAELALHGPNFVSAVAWCGDTVPGQTSATSSFAIEGPLGSKRPIIASQKP